MKYIKFFLSFLAGVDFPEWQKLVFKIFCIGFLQIGILPFIRVFKIKPDLLLVCAVLISLNYRSFHALAYILFCGIFKDIFGFNIFGFNAALFCFYGWGVNFISRYVDEESPGMKYILVSAITLFNYLLLSAIFKKPYILTGLVEAVLNCMVVPFLSRFYLCPARLSLLEGAPPRQD